MKNKVFRRFLRRKVSVAAAIILLTIILACIFGPMFITTDPLEQDILNAYQAPSSAHWFGTDNMGRDIFIRMLYGGRNSLSISFEGVILGTFIGVMLGVCAGYFGGLVEPLSPAFWIFCLLSLVCCWQSPLLLYWATACRTLLSQFRSSRFLQ